ncbi:odorant receptor 22c-like [Harpegnathos saltator]|uniref:odorant receptor 22c-like n=1 Tax=Harpegnathos saltator TaxID=610380 RepID=UPI000948D06A|nr:odorant receptor 22c-like [Harpegnathos saltator]
MVDDTGVSSTRREFVDPAEKSPDREKRRKREILVRSLVRLIRSVSEERGMRTSTFSWLLKVGLHFYGVWPYLPSTVLFRSYCIIAMTTAQVFQYGYIIVNSDTDNFSEFMDGVSSAMTHSLFFIKLIILWINQRKFSDILRIMTMNWQDHTSNHHSLNIMTKATFLARRISRIIFHTNFFSVCLYSLGVLAANAGDPKKWEPYNRELILKMKLPFEISTYPIYVTVTVVQIVHLIFIAWGIAIVNMLLVTLVLHIGGQIDVLRDWLTRAFSRTELDEITSRLLIMKHQQIILLSENIENLYTYIAFMILLSDTLIICCLGFVIATSLGEPNAAAILVKSLMFYVTMNLDVFVYCFAGEYLSAKSKMIGDAAYDSLWYNVAAKDSQIVLLIVLRSQKRLTITCGKIIDLSLERFTSVVKASASYMSVLLAMY